MSFLRDPFTQEVGNCVRSTIRREAAPYQKQIPVPIEMYVEQWGGVVVFDPPGSVQYEGLSVWDQDRQMVFINRNRPHVAQRFALAHEVIGHGWFHRNHLQATSLQEWLANPLMELFEVEANVAAAEFLLPYPWILEVCHARWGREPLSAPEFITWIHSPDAAAVARQAQVSVTVLGIHICDLSLTSSDCLKQWRSEEKQLFSRSSSDFQSKSNAPDLYGGTPASV